MTSRSVIRNIFSLFWCVLYIDVNIYLRVSPWLLLQLDVGSIIPFIYLHTSCAVIGLASHHGISHQHLFDWLIVIDWCDDWIIGLSNQFIFVASPWRVTSLVKCIFNWIVKILKGSCQKVHQIGDMIQLWRHLTKASNSNNMAIASVTQTTGHCLVDSPRYLYLYS